MWQKLLTISNNGILALFCYDLLLTISAEITYIWKPKFSPTTYCYFVNRYTMLANRGVRLAGFVLWNHRAFKHADDVRSGLF